MFLHDLFDDKMTFDPGTGPATFAAPTDTALSQIPLQPPHHQLEPQSAAACPGAITGRCVNFRVWVPKPDLLPAAESGDEISTLKSGCFCTNRQNKNACTNVADDSNGSAPTPPHPAAALTLVHATPVSGVVRIIGRTLLLRAELLLLALLLLLLTHSRPAPQHFSKLNRSAVPTTSKPRANVVAPATIAIMLCAACLQGIAAADVTVRVDPSAGVDSSSCGTASPCQTIAYAIRSRNATIVLLSSGYFKESNVIIDGSAPFVNIIGSNGSSVCDRSPGTPPGPAFSITNTAVSISGVTFRNYANFNVLNGVGGAISASGSNVTVSNCSFFNNTAQTGGAIGVTSGSLTVSSSSFQNNTATCPNAASTTTACSAWGGAIGAVEALSVLLTGSTFSSNAVNLVLESVTSSTSQAVGGGGCVSVLHNLNVLERRVTISGNDFQSCSVQMFGNVEDADPPVYQGIQYGSTYGGAVSLYYGLSAVNSLVVQNVRSTFTFNTCRNSGIVSTVGVAGNAYGGCLSVYAGAWRVNPSGDSRIGSLYLSGMRSNISGNTISNCSIRMGNKKEYISPSANFYGGSISLAVGAYAYCNGDYCKASISGSTTVHDCNYTVTDNTMTGCSVATLGSRGANGYGGGMSLAVGAYAQSNGYYCKTIISGHTTASLTNYIITGNTMTYCRVALSSATSSHGANGYGGGMSLAVGAYAYSFYEFLHYGSESSVTGRTIVSNTSYIIASNVLIGCSVSFTGLADSNGANGYGGGLSLSVGAYSDSSTISTVSGSTTVIHTSYIISGNNLSKCSVSSSSKGGTSNGANGYGGGVSLAVGAYSYALTGNGARSGDTMVDSTIFLLSKNSMSGCTVSLEVTSCTSSNGANRYGGGLSLALGAYSYSNISESFSGSTMVSNTSYIIASNVLIGCSVTVLVTGGGSSIGGNGYGGGMSLSVGSYAYSHGSKSESGSTMVIHTSYTLTNNNMTSCSVTSLVSDLGSSEGASVYGGCMALAVGSYSFSRGICGKSGSASGNTTVRDTNYTITGHVLTNCSSSSLSGVKSNNASAYGGAIALVHDSSSYASKAATVGRVVGISSAMLVSDCIFLNCSSMSDSSSNAAGGAMFSSVPSLHIEFISSIFANSSAVVSSASSASSAYSVGGCLSVLQAGNVSITSTHFTSCVAQGVPQATNVFVSGGGLHVQASDALFLNNCSISSCSVLGAFSSFVQCGGGAMGTQNVPSVQIFGSNFRDNSDSSATGSIFLQQLKDSSVMDVVFNRSAVFVRPSSTPALNVSCGSSCSGLQQRRITLMFQNSNLSSYSEADSTPNFESSAIMSLPKASIVRSDNSLLNCNFIVSNNLAILAAFNQHFVTITCAPCVKPYQIALTSTTLNLSSFHNVTKQSQQCQSVSSGNAQRCPYGVVVCSTIVSISVGFWATFSADGTLSNATRCPQNYCGCRNIERYNDTTCQLDPPFALGYQSNLSVNYNLCSGNRSGVLCGGCKTGYTQSLDGYSCVSNDVCLRNIVWTWAVTVIGYIIYSIYIVVSSLQTSKTGLIQCMVFYGQMSAFAQLSAFTQRTTGPAKISAWLPQVLQFESITSLYADTCYATDLGAYAFTVLQLGGPAIVLFCALALTLVLKRARPFLQRRNVNVEISTFATCSYVILLIFASVATVAFKLVTCSKIAIGDSTKAVVFIDGNVECYSYEWKVFIAVVVLLCMFPFIFAAALRWKWLPVNVQIVVCGAYSELRFYWGAVTLIFRLVMSIVFVCIRSFPSNAALVQSFLCIAILILLVHQKPYRHASTYILDIICHSVLAIQYVILAILTVPESLGIVPSETNLYFDSLNRAALANLYLRYSFRYFYLKFHCLIF
jgi:hypothetical protein